MITNIVSNTYTIGTNIIQLLIIYNTHTHPRTHAHTHTHSVIDDDNNMNNVGFI